MKVNMPIAITAPQNKHSLTKKNLVQIDSQ